MKYFLTPILAFAFLFSNAQTKKPATAKPSQPTELQRVRSKVIAETKGMLELPKYFKLEKVTVELALKAQYVTDDIGIEINNPKDSMQNCKYFILAEFSMCDLVTKKAYKVDSIQVINGSYFVYYNGNELPCMFSENSYNISFYKSYRKEKRWVNSYYDTKIIYWAMSKGGQVRLYTDLGIAEVEKSGKITYVVTED